MLKISANDAQLTVVACGPITSDRIDLPCEITLSPEFDGLAVTVVFKAGDVQRDVAMLGSPVHVPAECLEQAGEVLMVGIWAGDGSGRPTIPTVWASAGTIRTGALPSGYDPDEPEPDWAAQVQQAAANAVATANSVRADADAGVFDGEDGYSPSATVTQGDGSATITITDKDGTTTATVHDGTDGRDGTDGADGYSPTATVTQTASGATISITDKSGTTTASVSNGTDGTDGTDGVDGFSPTVNVQEITGGHEVTITDADGAHSFEVMDGDPSAPGSITDEMLAPDGVKAQVAQLFGNQPVGELSGTIDTAADAYAAPPMALTVEGASTQAGTPTPDAPVPIFSVDDLELVVQNGPNMLDTSAWVEDKYIGADGVIGTERNIHYTENYSRVIPGTYVLNMHRSSTSSSYVRLHGYDKDYRWVRQLYFEIIYSGNSWDARAGIVIDSDIKYVRVSCHSTMTELQLELGSTATAYEPYVGNTVPLYDGTLRSLPDGTKDTLNLSYLRPSTRPGWAWYSRELVQRVGELDLGEQTWRKGSRNYADTGYIFSNSNATDIAPLAKSGLCTSYVNAPNFAYNGANERLLYGQFALKQSLYANGWLLVCDEYETANDFKAAVSGVTVLYPLITPATTTIDPIELPELPTPTATVFCDGGSATPTYTMQYVQDTNIVIGELRAALDDLATS